MKALIVPGPPVVTTKVAGLSLVAKALADTIGFVVGTMVGGVVATGFSLTVTIIVPMYPLASVKLILYCPGPLMGTSVENELSDLTVT
ncbi:MAG: hypothetical protein BWY93_01797 [Euryarchaeota archaeon ADurb.BinA087]|nr:MAG: hypothetical protein BWY93_01797 [Euryarchaeota archaeon ADurb.BinA087]